MKLIIQIPCYNEEQTLPVTVSDLPRKIQGIECIEVLVIDDGSSDRTSEAARRAGVQHVVRFTHHQGLARAFAEGLDASLRLGADIIVNTDADHQYRGEDIPRLIEPILQGRADIVVGTRDIESMEHFSRIKKMLQRLGSSFVRTVSHTTIPDVTSGFRAYARDAAMRMNVISDFTYTLETIIQAGTSGMAIDHVPVRTNKQMRPSRLFSSLGEYLGKSIVTIFRIYTMYRPLKVFTWIGGLLFAVGALLVIRFLYYYFVLYHQPTGHIQSLIIAAICLLIGFQVIMFGLLADLIAKNRKLVEDVLLRTKSMTLDQRHGTERRRTA